MASRTTKKKSKRRPLRSASNPSEFRAMFVPILNEEHPAIRIAKPGRGKSKPPVRNMDNAIERFRKLLQAPPRS
jgi:hypothetical protein